MRSLTRSSARRNGAAATVATLAPPAAAPVLAQAPQVEVLTQLLLDERTGLGSLLALRHHLEQIIDASDPFGPRPTLMLVDVDRFRQINSTHGRAAGDQVIEATAARLRALVPGGSGAYRTGGDEFVALLDSISTIDAVAWAGGMQQALSEPVELDGFSIRVTVSVAVVMLGHRRRVDGLLRDADVTMYRAKAEGGNRVDVYNWEVDSWSTARKRDTERLAREVDELRMRNRALTEAITIDPVMGMPNSMAFDADHLQLHARWKRSGDPYSVLRARVDGLDDLRDALRSPEGAKSLMAIAHAIRDTVRQSDRAYLLEDGEFAVLLQGAALQHAIAAAQRLRSRIDKLGVENPGDPSSRLTVTIAALEAGFRHSDMKDVLVEVNDLLHRAAGGEPASILWPR